jgi:hypothetical protein
MSGKAEPEPTKPCVKKATVVAPPVAHTLVAEPTAFVVNAPDSTLEQTKVSGPRVEIAPSEPEEPQS